MSALFANTGAGECSGLVSPAGGRLVDLRVGGEERRELVRASDDLPTIPLDRRAEIDLTLLAHGAYSPLDRFLGSAERRSVVDHLRLADGSFFPLPVTLEVPDSSRNRLESASSAALRSVQGELLAVLEVDEVYRADGRTYVAGRPRVVKTPVDPAWRRFHWNPREARECLDRYARSHVVALTGSESLGEDRRREIWAHVESLDAVLLVHPPGVPSEELQALARSRRDRACVALLPWAEQNPGVPPERELLARALVHRNYGANHVLVDGRRRGTLDLLERHWDETGIAPLPLGVLDAVEGAA